MNSVVSEDKGKSRIHVKTPCSTGPQSTFLSCRFCSGNGPLYKIRKPRKLFVRYVCQVKELHVFKDTNIYSSIVNFFLDNQQFIFCRKKVHDIKEDTTSFVQDIEKLWIDMYERGFIEEADVKNIQGVIAYYSLFLLIVFVYKSFINCKMIVIVLCAIQIGY